MTKIRDQYCKLCDAVWGELPDNSTCPSCSKEMEPLDLLEGYKSDDQVYGEENAG